MFYYPDYHHLLDQLIWIHWKMSKLVVGSLMRKPLWMSVKRAKILFENCWSNKKKKGWTHMNAFNMLGWLVIIGKLLVQFHEIFLFILQKNFLKIISFIYSHKTLEIARNRFFAIREKIRQKYANWNEFVLPLGRLSEFSSLRKLQMEKYRMQEVLIDRKCAAPRFVIKPQSTFALEGHSARFTCRIIRYSTNKYCRIIFFMSWPHFYSLPAFLKLTSKRLVIGRLPD